MPRKTDVSCGQLLIPKAATKKRIVSTPRKKKGEIKVKVDFSASPAERKNLNEIAARMKISRAHLILKALDRCQHDGIWRKETKKSSASNKSFLPDPEIVALSNVLLEFSFVVDSLLKTPENPKLLDQASRIFLDAREGLAKLRDELGC